MSSYVINQELKLLQRHEPAYVWMYWHPVKQGVCVGHGHRLPSLKYACELRWTMSDKNDTNYLNGITANRGHVDVGWGYVAQTHCAYWKLHIDSDDVRALAHIDIEQALSDLAAEWTEEIWEQFPSAVQIALVDMQLTEDPPSEAMRAAISKGEWRVAAIHAMRERQGPMGPAHKKWNGSRNQEIEALFHKAAAG